MNVPAPVIIPLNSNAASRNWVGGKARSLSVLLSAGLPVPSGFVISTTGYQNFVAFNQLEDDLQVAAAQASDRGSLERHSNRIRERFANGSFSEDLASQLSKAYSQLAPHEEPVAVRSSATAEDLPDHSFAGQQETLLNVRGPTEFVSAVRSCWASLWSPRAITYRERSGLQDHRVAMAVVVQLMVAAESAGVLFTANPATGARTELVINANFGLGESVVSGLVTPDTFIVDRARQIVKQTQVGGKEKVVVGRQQGIVIEELAAEQRNQPSLSEQVIGELVKLSLQVEQLFSGVPQDIEWAIADGVCWLLQSRPITNLPAAPLEGVRWEPPSAGGKLIRRQVVEHMPGPLSPLFEELYLQGGLERALDQLTEEYGIPIKMEDFMERPMFLTVHGYAYCRANWRSMWRILPLIPRVMLWYFRALPELMGDAVPRWQNRGLPRYLETIERWRTRPASTLTEEELLEGLRSLAAADAAYWFDVTVVLGCAKMADGALDWYLRTFVRRGLNSGTLLRGFASCVVQGQRDLEVIAERVLSDEATRDWLTSTPPAQLLADLPATPAGQSLRNDLSDYFTKYGHQIYSLDFAEPTLGDDPVPVLISLQSIVKAGGRDSLKKQEGLAAEREAAVEQLRTTLGPLRRRAFTTLYRWAERYAPFREDTLFYLGAAWPTLRLLALELGDRLRARGELKSADHVFYLTTSEIAEAVRSDGGGEYRALAEQRYQLREARRRLHPPGMVPPGSSFRMGPFSLAKFETQKRNTDDARTLNGFAVSPGRVTGTASVILSPGDFDKMQPGSILVCPTTSPAWTPLFAEATGLVTDIGGILAHGSIVAREYGIPAVMGTGNGTQRIANGQRIKVDGDKGTVALADEGDTSRVVTAASRLVITQVFQ